MDQLKTINIIENDTATQSIRSALNNTTLVPSNLNSESKDVEDSNCNITVICHSYDNTQSQDILYNGVTNSNHNDLGSNKLSERYESTECLEPDECVNNSQLTNNSSSYSCKNCDNGHILHDSSHFNTSQPKSLAPINNGPKKSLTKLKSLSSSQGNNDVHHKHEKKHSSESINGSTVNKKKINPETKASKEANNYSSKTCVKNKLSNVNNNNTDFCSSQETQPNQNTVQSTLVLNQTNEEVSGNIHSTPELCSTDDVSKVESSALDDTSLKVENLEIQSGEESCTDLCSPSQQVEPLTSNDIEKSKTKHFECNPCNVHFLCCTDEMIGGIKYVSYKSELQMPDIIKLIQKDLSEPYSIYTYRYFIHNWPKFCFLAMDEQKCVGAIVCKLDIHRKVIRRGYIAMLAVDENYRKRKIGSNLVLKAIRAMVADDADEVVLETEITNRPALKLYENLGFVRDKRLFRYYLNGVDALRLKLWLR
ncbi:hypothetical protein M8J76_011542 [Diaphorina citri]|nr:hypothetical protein M8J75_006917 [Diaphorina citri]KAI5726943.1 hypothetical protein M8J76_011542 [Diaphorina citri]KAI5731373.1 hypothetical protein M8J77_009026 [Diaphorina citri]